MLTPINVRSKDLRRPSLRALPCMEPGLTMESVPSAPWLRLPVRWKAVNGCGWRMSGGGMMQIGIFARTFFRLTLEDILEVIKAEGLSFVQFKMSCAGVFAIADQIE